jgi:amino acid transporter
LWPVFDIFLFFFCFIFMFISIKKSLNVQQVMLYSSIYYCVFYLMIFIFKLFLQEMHLRIRDIHFTSSKDTHITESRTTWKSTFRINPCFPLHKLFHLPSWIHRYKSYLISTDRLCLAWELSILWRVNFQ